MIGSVYRLVDSIAGEAWGDEALCQQTDPEIFFPEQGTSTARAKRICLVCPCLLECREFALRTDQKFGVWGGLDERERKAAVRKRKGR